MPGKIVRKVVYYEGVIPQKDVLPVYTRESGGIKHIVIGAKVYIPFVELVKNIKEKTNLQYILK